MIGSGPYPANPNGHEGFLVTPSINLSNYSSVTLTFNSYYREYAGVAKVDFSTDGGYTFTNELEVHPHININATTSTDFEARINLPSNIAGNSNVKIRFRYDGTILYGGYYGYYFWMIDDVRLIETPSNLLTVSYTHLTLPTIE